MTEKELPGVSKNTFKLVLDKNFKCEKYIAGFDPYDENSESYSLSVVTKPKKQFRVRRVRGFLRIVDIGYSHIVKIVK